MSVGIYDKWAGNPQGSKEDVLRCVEEVSDPISLRLYQCSRKRGYGPDGQYCKQHAKRYEREKP